jgi:hypothetical protein
MAFAVQRLSLKGAGKMREALKNAATAQLKGRARAWKVAFLLSAILLILRFYQQKPTCALMFYPADLAKDYVILWLCLFVFIGLTKRGKLLFGIVILVALVVLAPGLVHYRIPSNEYRTVLWLQDMRPNLKVANHGGRNLTDVLNSAPFDRGHTGGYLFEYSPHVSEGKKVAPSFVTARPWYYCKTGQRSFLLAESGSIHYTYDDRQATPQDPALQ